MRGFIALLCACACARVAVTYLGITLDNSWAPDNLGAHILCGLVALGLFGATKICTDRIFEK